MYELLVFCVSPFLPPESKNMFESISECESFVRRGRRLGLHEENSCNDRQGEEHSSNNQRRLIPFQESLDFAQTLRIRVNEIQPAPNNLGIARRVVGIVAVLLETIRTKVRA